MSFFRRIADRLEARKQGLAAAAPTRTSAQWRSIGNAALQDNRLEEAEQAYREAVNADNADALAHLNLGFALLEREEPGAAQESLARALALRKPDQPILQDIHFLLGRAWRAQGDAAQAVASFEAALRAQPAFAEAAAELARARLDLAQSQLDAGDAARALRTLDELQSKEGAHPSIAYLRGNALFALERYEEAAAAYESAFAAEPAFAEAAANAGASWVRLGNGEKALARIDDALKLQPLHAQSLSNRVIALDALGRRDEALQAARTAHELVPGDPFIAWSYGATALLHGDYANGWPGMEHRWSLPGAGQPPDAGAIGSARWTGEPLAGRSLLLVAEQGFGDTLQFLRYAQPLRQQGAHIVLQVQDALEDLVRTSLPHIEVVAQSKPWPRTDFHIPLMSVPGATATTEATIPGTVPYLEADRVRVAKWRKEFPAGRLRVGLSWSGNPAQANDRNRSSPLAPWLRLMRDDIEFVSLQRDVRPADAEALRRSPIRDVSRELGSFADTAALMEVLDLVITVDTSVAHLAGALGRPLWIVLAHRPDWRYLLDRDDSPWYPSARLFRQAKPRAWDALMDAVAGELQRWAATHPASA